MITQNKRPLQHAQRSLMRNAHKKTGIRQQQTQNYNYNNRRFEERERRDEEKETSEGEERHVFTVASWKHGFQVALQHVASSERNPRLDISRFLYFSCSSSLLFFLRASIMRIHFRRWLGCLCDSEGLLHKPPFFACLLTGDWICLHFLKPEDPACLSF